MSGRLKMKCARSAVGYAIDVYWLASDLSATNFGQKFSPTHNQMFFSTRILLSIIIFFNFLYNIINTTAKANDTTDILQTDILQTLLHNISKIALLRYSRVSFKKLNGWEVGHWLTANFTFPAVTRKNIVWYNFRCNKHLPGQSASIIIAFEFFGMFVSTRTWSVFFVGWGKLCLFSK